MYSETAIKDTSKEGTGTIQEMCVHYHQLYKG